MKKAICILLILAVMMTCCVVGVSAKCTIPDTLREQMDAVENGKFKVHIWLYCPIDKSTVFQQAIKECGYIGGLPLNMTLDEVYAYKAVYNRIISEQEAAVADSFIEKLGIAEEDIEYHGKHPYVIAFLTEDQIETAASFSEVEGIYYDLMDGQPIVTPTEPPTESASSESPYLYQARFEELYGSGYDWCDYQELYYHIDQNGETDWALVYAFIPAAEPIELVTIVGNRVLYPGTMYMPFDACYGIYDVKEDKFIDAGSSEAKNYDGFLKVFDEIDDGRLIGDLDRDGDLSVVDVTILQRCEANMREYPDDDTFSLTFEWGKSRYYSDFDRDGERTILDATRLQRYLISE